jgi:hypothetical protein
VHIAATLESGCEHVSVELVPTKRALASQPRPPSRSVVSPGGRRRYQDRHLGCRTSLSRDSRQLTNGVTLGESAQESDLPSQAMHRYVVDASDAAVSENTLIDVS